MSSSTRRDLHLNSTASIDDTAMTPAVGTGTPPRTPPSQTRQLEQKTPPRANRTPIPLSPIFTPDLLRTPPSRRTPPRRAAASPMSPLLAGFGLNPPSPLAALRIPSAAASAELHAPTAVAALPTPESPGLDVALSHQLALVGTPSPEPRKKAKDVDKEAQKRLEREKKQEARKRRLEQQAVKGKLVQVAQQPPAKKRELLKGYEGPHGDAYLGAFQAALGLEEKPPYENLGNVSNLDTYYFDVNADTKKCASAFLSAFWAHEKHRQVVIAAHQQKYQRGLRARRTLTAPSCISFVTARLKNKNLCFVSVSFTGSEINQDIWNLIGAFLAERRKNLVNDFKFTVPLDSASANYHKLIDELTPVGNKAADPTRECAEKSFSSNLTKLFREYGSDLYITGVINCPFYPYEQQKNAEYNVQGSTVTLPAHDAVVNLDDTFFTVSIACCPNCQSNKEAILKTFLAAQREATRVVPEQKIDPRFLSPLKPSVTHSIFTPPPKGQVTPTKRTPERRQAGSNIDSGGGAAAAVAANAAIPMPIEEKPPTLEPRNGVELLAQPLRATRHASAPSAQPPFAIGALAAARAAQRRDDVAMAAALPLEDDGMQLPPSTRPASTRPLCRRLF